MLLDFPSVLDERLKRRAVGNLLGSESFQIFQFRLVLAGKSSHRPGNSPFKRRWYRSERLLQETHPSFFFFRELFHEPAWWWTGAARTGRSGFPGSHRHDDKAAG